MKVEHLGFYDIFLLYREKLVYSTISLNLNTFTSENDVIVDREATF